MTDLSKLKALTFTLNGVLEYVDAIEQIIADLDIEDKVYPLLLNNESVIFQTKEAEQCVHILDEYGY